VTDSELPRSNEIDFRLGAPVHTADGHHAGSLVRIVVDAESWDPRALIVRETNHFSGRTLAPGAGILVSEVIVPFSAIASASDDGIRLTLDKRTTRALPPYLSYQYKPLERGDGLRFAAALAGGSLGVGPMFPLLQETADKAEGDIEIRKGENVMFRTCSSTKANWTASSFGGPGSLATTWWSRSVFSIEATTWRSSSG
jgi:sporulation protein YlmC with PRC-barrel domain